MKKKYGTFIAAALVPALLSCSKAEQPAPLEPQESEYSFKVRFESPVKTTFDGNEIDWSKFDGISVFDTTANNLFITRDESVKEAVFIGTARENDKYVALFPYYSKATYMSGKIATYLPPTQKSYDKTFGGMINIAAGIANGDRIELHNVCGYIKFTLDSKINQFSSATLAAVAEEPISGALSINLKSGEPVATASGLPYVKVIPGKESIESGEYYIIAAPATFAEGLSFTFTRIKDGATYTKTFTGVSVERNKICDLGLIDPDDTWAQVSSVSTGTASMKAGVISIKGNKISLVDALPENVTYGICRSVDGGATWTETEEAAALSEGSFDWEGSGYNFNTEYMFKAWARYKDNEIVYGEPLIFNARITAVTVGSLALNGTTLNITGNSFSAENCDLSDIICGVELSADGGSSWTEAGKSEPVSDHFDVHTTVTAGTAYLVRAFAQAGNTDKVYSETADMSPRISEVVTGTAALDGKNVIITGNSISAQFCDVSAIVCGLETSRDGSVWTEVSKGQATAFTFDGNTTISKQGTTYFRAWAAIGDQDKVFGSATSVSTQDIVLNFDFSTADIVKANISVVGTSDAEHPLTELPLTDRVITGEDTYSYSFSDYETQIFKVYSHWVSGARGPMTYRIFSSSGLRCTSAGNKTGGYYFMSFPAIAGYKLVAVDNCCTQTGRKMSIVSKPVQSDGETTLASSNGTSEKDASGYYTATMDISAAASAGVAYYAAFKSNGYNSKLICHYTKMNENE